MIKAIIICISVFCLTFLFNAEAAALPIPAENAFVFSAHLEKSRRLIAEWHIAPGYYLYRNKFHIISIPPRPARLGAIVWPVAQTKRDTMQGFSPIYEGIVRVIIPLIGRPDDGLTLAVQYQGCSHEGYCYAPIEKQIHIAFPFVMEGLHDAPLLTFGDVPVPPSVKAGDKLTAESSTLVPEMLTNQAAVKTFLSGHISIVTILCFMGLGLLLAFTPCVLPMIPILSSIIVGQHIVNTKKAFYLSLAYVFGVASMYAIAGMLMTWLGSSIQVYFQNPQMIGAFSLLFVLLALSMLDLFPLRLPGKWQKKIMGWHEQMEEGTYISVFVMGCFSTLIISPCVTAPLVGVLAYVTETGNVALGGAALFALGLGMGIPLLLLGFSMGKYLPSSGPWMDVIKKFFAFILLGVAIWMLSRIFDAGVILFLWASLLLLIAAYFLFFMDELSSTWRYLGYGIGIIFALYGFALFVGVALNRTSPFYPLTSVFARHQVPSSLNFVVIKDMSHLNAMLEQAKHDRKPVMIDFYADWCESCQEMKKTVLNQPEIESMLHSFILLRADVTANNVFDQALMKRYDVVAPPVFLFLDQEGQEQIEKRMVGEVSSEIFLTHISSL